MPCYRAYGLTIDSELEIPGAIPIDVPPAIPDLAITWGKAEMAAGSRANGPYLYRDGSILFEAPGIARYLFCPPSGLIVEPLAAAGRGEICALLVATALPMVLWARGGLVLHACGVVLPGSDHALAIAGPSGVGKSTLADALVELGGRLVGDDTLWLQSRGGETWVRGLPASYFLPQSDPAVRQVIAVPEAQRVEEARLGAVVAIARIRQRSSAAVQRLHGPAALQILLQNRHRPRIPALLGRDKEVLQQAASHCAQSRIYACNLHDDDLHAALEQLIGLNRLTDNQG